MTSPIQPPPNIRSPSNHPQPPYTHHLPPPNLPPPNLPPPTGLTSSRMTELPSLLSSPAYSDTILPPPRTSPPYERTMMRPPASPVVIQQPSPTGGSYRPLNVRDALTYLDQVKIRFSDQPDVYNRFLDIMKDFKSQTIDTPGVIERVSTLFKGHPTLISGFNTFLPPGYRIECSTDPREPDLIMVTTPNGVTTSSGRLLEPNSPQQNYYSYQPPPQQHHHHHQQQQQQPPPPPPPPPQQVPPPLPPQPQVPPPTQQPSFQTMARPIKQMSSPLDSPTRSPVEFNHAINYVNKIKNRYSNDPEVYKQFLEILQTYQKDQKPIQEVYAHVQYLFHGATDLLEEFKQFLPDITGQPSNALFESIPSPNYFNAKRSTLESSPSNSILPPGKKKKHNNATLKKTKPYQKESSMTEAFSSSPFDPIRPSVSTEEIELFEKIRKHIGNKPSYEEFLKTLNLYTQQIFDLDTLVDQVKIFLGNNKELYDWFKMIVGYEPKDHPIEKPVPHVPKPDLVHCKPTKDSPSYRIVPQNWSTQPCSGRDQLAWEVLNDQYVSHPIWASEDDGFVASRKSQYEEAMHRCEEERYDYNMNIEANLNVIALLEPIQRSIDQMTAEEKSAMRLGPGLGGQSVTIYERIIKKVYEKERGLEIIELLYTNPTIVIPILLKRLKQKDEEWKKAQREWNKIWREHDAKNYYRALDYQGITFKSNDRKALAPKALVNEIENIRDKKPGPAQFEFPLDQPEPFKDVTRVIYSFIDRQSGYSHSDREKIRTFIQTFIPLCFQIENVMPDGIQYTDEADEDDLAEDDDDTHSTNTEESESDRSPHKRSQSPSRKKSNTKSRNHHEDERTMDLLRDVLTKNLTVQKETVLKQEEQVDEVMVGDRKLLDAAAAVIAPEIKKRNLYSFFCNTTFYCFFRQYEMLYSRLARLRHLDQEMKKNPMMGKRVNKVARDLGLYSSRFDDVDVSNGLYEAVLDMIDRFFDGDMDQQAFEEQTRYLFVTDAYLIFTIDKLVHSIVKQIQSITVDPKSVELIRLFRNDKGLESISPRILSVYRLKAEDVIGSDENLYKINFDNEAKKMTIQLIGKDDYMMEPTAADKYEDYVASYMDWINTTEGVSTTDMKPTFLTRNLRPQDGHLEKIVVRSQLQYKIDQNSYHMYYIVGSEDIFVRPHPTPDSSTHSLSHWLDSLSDGEKKTMEDEARKLLSV